MDSGSRFSLDRLRQPLLIFTHDLLMVAAAWLGSYWVRFNLSAIPEDYLARALQVLPLVVGVQAITFYMFGMYRGVWRFASLPDLVRIMKAVATGTIVIMVILSLLYRLIYTPRSIVLLYPLLLLIFLSGPRFLYRWSRDDKLNLKTGKRVLIVGAGQAGEMLVRDLLRKQGHDHVPVAFVDDKPRRQGQDLHGVPVVGSCDDLPAVVKRLDIELSTLCRAIGKGCPDAAPGRVV